jgi:hypothetical protein
VVHHPRHQYRGPSGGADLMEDAVGRGQSRQAGTPGAVVELVPA